MQFYVKLLNSLNSLVFDNCKVLQKFLAHSELKIHVKACEINFKNIFIALDCIKISVNIIEKCANYVIIVNSSLQAFFNVKDKVYA